jgi:Amt family ammonium transporter
MGWFGFNAGSALSGASLAVQAVLNTQVASTMSATVWLFMIMAQRKKPSIVALINGAIAGLAGITPASGYVSAQSALVIGIVLGLSSYWSIYLLKHKLKIDDALDVASVHGVTGIVGSFAIGICADKTINESGENGWIYGNPRQMGIQTLGIVVAGVWSALVTLVLALIIKRFSKTSEEDEKLGLDEVEIEEKYAYNYHKDQLMHQLEQIVHEEEIEKEEHEANQVIITENVNSTYESGLKSRHHDEQSPLIE